MTPTKRILEALLFSSHNPLSNKDLITHIDKGQDIVALMLELQNDYAERGIHIVRIDQDKWAMRSAPDMGPYLQIIKEPLRKLGPAVLETLTICAYHQPITRREIEDIRGHTVAGSTMDILLRLGWIKPSGRRKTPGKPVNWVTTPNFLDHFGLESCQDLPRVDELEKLDLLSYRATASNQPS